MRKQGNITFIGSVLLQILAGRRSNPHPSAVHFQLSSAIISSLLPSWHLRSASFRLAFFRHFRSLNVWRLAQALSILDLQKCAKCLRPSNMQKNLKTYVLFCFHHLQWMKIGRSTIKKTRYLRRAPGWLHIKSNMSKDQWYPLPCQSNACKPRMPNAEIYHFPMQVLDWKSIKVMVASTVVMYNLVLNDLNIS